MEPEESFGAIRFLIGPLVSEIVILKLGIFGISAHRTIGQINMGTTIWGQNVAHTYIHTYIHHTTYRDRKIAVFVA